MKRNLNRLHVRRLKLKPLDYIMLLGAIGSIIALLLGLSNYMERAKQSETNLIQEEMNKEGHNLKAQFDELLENKVEILQALASYPDVYEMDEARQKRFLKQRAFRFGFNHIFIMNMDGIGYYIDEDVHRDQSEEEFFQNLMNNDVFITEPFYTEQGVVFSTICVPILNTKLEKVGVLCGALRLNNMQNVIMDNETVLNGECFILDKEGKYLTSDELTDVTYQVSIFSKTNSELSLIRKALDEKENQKGRVMIEGVEYQTNITYIHEFDWLIVQNIPVTSIVARFEALNIIQGSLSVAIIVLIVCIVRIIYRWYKNINKIYKDPLTECNSRAACLDLLDNVENKYRHRLTLVYMDLNRFKYVNDTYGHDKGDELLCIFSKSIEETFGKLGFVGRMGGDEFIAILQEVPDEEIKGVWAELEQLLLDKSKLLDIDYVITSSYGFASREKGEKVTLETLTHRADEKMYEYKAWFKQKNNM